MSYPLIISLHSARMKCSFSGVRMHSEFFWPVLDSPSMTSEHWFILIVPCGRVLGCRTQQKTQIDKVLTDVPAPRIRPHDSVFSHYPPQHQFSCQAWHATHWHSLHSQMFLLGLSVIFLFLVPCTGAFHFSYHITASYVQRFTSFTLFVQESITIAIIRVLFDKEIR